MSERKKIEQNDKNRFLVSEVIPYETPLRFSFSSIHRAVREKTIGKLAEKIIFGGSKFNRFSPYEYEVYVRSTKTRSLGIFHPHVMESVRGIYSDHDLDILSMCRKSDWSLRAPYSVAKTYRPHTLFYSSKEDLESETEHEKYGSAQANFSSYFAYNKCTHLSQFYESKQYTQLESQFQNLITFDVSSCFGSIYTHSIEWAIRTRAQAKKETGIHNRNHLGSKMDDLMQKVNSGETYGILVGSELSRIFAEIVFQQIDLDASKLCEENELFEGTQFSIRRYVDDYFLFYDDEKVAVSVKAIIEASLKKYKLHLNVAHGYPKLERK